MSQLALVQSPALTLTPTASAAAASAVVRAEVRQLIVTGPDVQKLLEAVSFDMEIAPTMEIDSDEMAKELTDVLGRLSTVSAAIENERKERGQPLRETLQWLMDGYSPARTALERLIEEGRAKLIKYSRAKDEARRIAVEAEAKQRREDAAIAAAAEAQAIADAKATAQAAIAARAEGSEQMANAMEADAAVFVDTARTAAAKAAQEIFAAPTKPSGYASGRASGVKGESVTWKAEVTDKAKLIQHIGAMVAAGDLSLISLLDVSEKSLNAMARLQQSNLSLPGVRPTAEAKVAIRKQAVAVA